MSTGAGAGSCCVGVLWRTAHGALTCLSVDERVRKFLLALARAAVVWDCVGDRMVELRHI